MQIEALISHGLDLQDIYSATVLQCYSATVKGLTEEVYTGSPMGSFFISM